MNWFLYGRDVRHEKIKKHKVLQSNLEKLTM